MSGSLSKAVPEINLDEFERRLRSAGAPAGGVEDPLAELARLVNMISRDGEKGQAGVRLPPMPKAETLAFADGPPVKGLTAHADSRPGSGWDGDAGTTPPPPSFGAAEPAAPEDIALTPEERADLLDAAMQAQAAKSRSRAWRFKTVGLAVIGVALLGGALALKHGGVPGLPKTPPLIEAAVGPTKVPAPNDANAQPGADAAALLMKDSTTNGPVKVVSSEEQPVDLRTQTPTPAPVAAVADTASPVAPAANTPIVASAETTATVAPLFPEAKPVKTVSVRPDGSLISVDSTPVATPAAPAAPAATRAVDVPPAPPAAAAGEPATPKLDLPTKLSPKSSARIVAKTDTTAPAAATDTTPNAPLQLAPPPAKPTKVVKTPPADDAPVVAAADPAPTTEAPAAGSGWAVQFAAPRSEEDAKKSISRLKSKYSAELGDASLGIRKADVKGEAIYRVRAADLSKAEAAALCSKVKAAGGDCFIARD